MKITPASFEWRGVRQVGGVADVARDLAEGMNKRGHQVTAFMPYHGEITAERIERALPYDLAVQLGDKWHHGGIYQTKIPDTGIELFLLGHNDGFFNENIYWPSENTGSIERLVYASKMLPIAIRELVKTGRMQEPDILHLHDAPFASAAAVIRSQLGEEKLFAKMGLVGTIHNAGGGYQGECAEECANFFELPREMIKSGNTRLLLGMQYAEMINTVSPQHAKELQTQAFGEALADFFASMADNGRFEGVMNGINVEQWKPETDERIIRREAGQSIYDWKRANKATLQEKVGLPPRSDIPLFVVVSRLAKQKFSPLMDSYSTDESVLEHLLRETEIQLVVLSEAQKKNEPEQRYEKRLKCLAEKYPEKFAFANYFDKEGEGRQFYAGGDFFVMVSIHEPAGLGQQFAMRYGTIPIVTPVGGLLDTIIPERGIILCGCTPGDIIAGFSDAESIYRQPEKLQAMRETAMAYDSSWEPSLKKYELMYEKALAMLKNH